jgi:HPt (histidine-containing phosphotransfer) domain-containing protein
MSTNTHPNDHDQHEDTLLDVEAIGGLRRMEQDLGPGLVEELIDIYLSDTPDRLVALTVAARTGDSVVLAEQSHALRSSCAQLGARSMEALCRLIEKAADAAQPLEGSRLVERLKREFDRLRPALLSECETTD